MNDYSLRVPEPGILQIKGEDGRELLAINPDGTVTGAIEDSGEAARLFVEALRIDLSAAPPQVDRDALYEAIADRLGEHSKAYNEFDPSDEAVTVITLRAEPVEVLAEFITDAVIAHLSAVPVEGERCSNPDCPLTRTHSGPCAPKGWLPIEGEVEWEYCIAFPMTERPAETRWETDGIDTFTTLEEARDEIETGNYLDSDQIVRRRKAGPWQEVTP